MQNRFNYIIFLLLLPGLLKAQEVLNPVSYNRDIAKAHKKLSGKPNNKAAGDTIPLPFFDDFNSVHPYPWDSLWQDNFVYINSHFPITPVTVGVATFDGLDETGYPYNFTNATAQGVADYLTSNPIDLSSTTGDVYLSFYYQPQGMGNEPEADDSLVLEFLDPFTFAWKNIWSAQGTSNKSFKQVMIKVDPYYHLPGFTFRFKNYATLSGSFDHWNLDYVYLDDNRNAGDTILDEVTYYYDPQSLIPEYTAMPWWHYQDDTMGNTVNEMTIKIRNHSNTTRSVFYRINIRDEKYNLVGNHPAAGIFQNVNANSTLNLTLPIKDSPFNFTFPTNDSCVTHFEVKNFFNLGTSDFSQTNDSVINHQVFGNYYAYDDGSAEFAYGLQGGGAKLAHEYSTSVKDTLTGVRFYFLPAFNNTSSNSFKLTIWKSLNPEVILYQQNGYSTPSYSSLNEYIEYPLDSIVEVNGTYFIGYEKISESTLNIGYDVNLDNSSKIWNDATGPWVTSTYSGSLMMQPVFGSSCKNRFTGKEEIKNESQLLKVYPNPVNQFLNIKYPIDRKVNAEIIDLQGKTVLRVRDIKNPVDVSGLGKGMYFVKLIDQSTQKTFTEKIIITD